MPLLDRLREVHRNEFAGGKELQASSSEHADDVPIHLDPNSVEIVEYLEMRSYPKKTLTKGDKIGYVEDSIWRDMV